MEIIVEGTKVEMALPRKGVSLSQVVGEVERYLFTVGRIPTELCVDGHSLTQVELEARQEDILSGREKLEFGVISVVDFVVENLDGIEPANADLLKNLKGFADQIYRKQSADGTVELASELAHFFDFWLRMRTLLPSYFSQVQVGEKTLSDTFEEVRGVLEETVTAMEEKDFILAADLIQYEIAPAIDSIGKGIPELRRLLQEAG